MTGCHRGFLFGVLLAALPVIAWAEPVGSPVLPDVVAAGSPMVAAADPDGIVAFDLSLPLRNEGALDALIADLGDPGSPRYRQYLTPAAFTDRFGPTTSDYAALIGFATGHGLTVVSTAPNRRLVTVAGPVRAIDAALHVRMGWFRDPAGAGLFLSPDREPTIDAAVPVLAITGLDTYAPPTAHMVRGEAAHATGSGPGGQFTGFDMRAAYYGGTALTGKGQSVGLLELKGYDRADVLRYFRTLGQPMTVELAGVPVDGARLACGVVDHCNDGEQSLDIEETIAMAPGLDRVLIYVGDRPLPILNRMATDDAAAQLSSSWGWHTDRAADEPVFKQFIVQGQSFVDATGDDGYHLAEGVVWPADDAFVTAVGGTDLKTNGPGGAWASETGWRFSGGGPSSNAIGLPRYQAPFVTAANGASMTLRNVPDISAEADTNNYSCFVGICTGGSGGTSYAAPRWAGFIALANEQAAAEGKRPVGFLNYFVYRLGAAPGRYARAFHDQTAGFNGRYDDVAGFDLVTGFGSPRGQGMIDALVGR